MTGTFNWGSKFRRLLLEIVEPGSVALDVGAGGGYPSLLMAGRMGWVVGVDRDASALAGARRKAAELGLKNAIFVQGDVEAEDYLDYLQWVPALPKFFDLVVAHLCLSDAVVQRASRCLKRGGYFLLAAFHEDQWKEVGGSRFSYSEARLKAALQEQHFRVKEWLVERSTEPFRSLEDARERLGDAVVGRWQQDGRWARLQENFRVGNPHVTQSRIVALCVKEGLQSLEP